LFGWHWDVDNIGRGNCFAIGWRYRKADTPEELIPIVTKYPNTPIEWRAGERSSKNFLRAIWIGIDVDEGLSLAEGMQIFQPYIHLIGTTRSHQKDKGGLIADRYRVFLKLNQVCENSLAYKATLSKIVAHVGADRACVDAARIFWPITEVVSCSYHGRLVRLVHPPEQHDPKYRERRIAKLAAEYHRRIPPFVSDYLTKGCPDGRRNATIFKCAVWLARCGFQEDEIFDMIWNSPIPISQSESLLPEVRKAVRNGISNK